jgi:hypothetical protein
VTDKFNELYEEIESLSDEIPSQLARKIYLYSLVLQWMGKYHAAAVLDYGKAYAERKRIQGEALINTKGTQRDKEGAAEVLSYEARLREAEAEAEMHKWKNAYNATTEIINALKIQQKTLMQEYGNGGNQL